MTLYWRKILGHEKCVSSDLDAERGGGGEGLLANVSAESVDGLFKIGITVLTVNNKKCKIEFGFEK